MSSTIIGRCNGTKSFLTGCIPNLKFYCFTIELDRADFLTKALDPEGNNLNILLTKSTPIVEIYDSVYVSSAKRRSKQDFPTPESPISRSLNK